MLKWKNRWHWRPSPELFYLWRLLNSAHWIWIDQHQSCLPSTNAFWLLSSYELLIYWWQSTSRSNLCRKGKMTFPNLLRDTRMFLFSWAGLYPSRNTQLSSLFLTVLQELACHQRNRWLRQKKSLLIDQTVLFFIQKGRRECKRWFCRIQSQLELLISWKPLLLASHGAS